MNSVARVLGTIVVAAAWLAAATTPAAAVPSARAGSSTPAPALLSPHDVDRLPNGNTLITDGGYPPGGAESPGSASKVIEVNPAGAVLWSFEQGLIFAHSADRLPNGNTLIADTGNDRVIEVDAAGNLVWSSDDVTLSDGSHLNYPNEAHLLLPGGHLLITDRDNHRVIEIARNGTVTWQFGETGVPGSDAAHLREPHNADRLPSPGGNTLIADSGNDRILEITPAGAIAWAYHPTGDQSLDWPRDADRLDSPGGSTLITDSRHGRVIEVTPGRQVVWQYGGLQLPFDADRLENGNTLISKAETGHVVEVSPVGAIAWSYPSGLVDVTLPASNTLGETLAVRVQAPPPGQARYAAGAPVIIWIAGGNECRDFRHGLPAEAGDLVIITFLFPGCTDEGSGLHSIGSYDDRGERSIRALRDVISYAAGELTDTGGRTIDQVVPVPVLHDNIGLIGVSNGGNLIVAAPALHGAQLAGHLRYVIQWETPVSSQIATRDLGRVWMQPFSAQGDYFNLRYLGYGPLILPVDYSDLAYNPAEPFYPIFHDGNGNGQYDTDPAETGQPPAPPDPDLDGSGVLEPDREDFPLGTYPDGARQVYSRPVTQALDDDHVFSGGWPAEIATPAEASAYWDIREAVRLYAPALAAMPRLEGMILASVEDHVQSAPDKPHIRQAFEGWRAAGAWVRINPSPSYLLEVDPTLDPAFLPDNAPNAAPADWAATGEYCIPENVPDPVYQLAAVWQMADRTQQRRLYLPLALRQSM